MKLDDLFPLIIILLIVFVSLLRAIFRAVGAAKKNQGAGPQRPSVWEEFRKALKTLAEEQRGEQEVITEEGPTTPTVEDRGDESEQAVIATATPLVVPGATPSTRHRPEDLGSSISREVTDIVHPPVEEHLRQRGLGVGAESASDWASQRRADTVAMLHLIGASSTDLRKAVLLQEILSSSLAERMPGPIGLR